LKKLPEVILESEFTDPERTEWSVTLGGITAVLGEFQPEVITTSVSTVPDSCAAFHAGPKTYSLVEVM
jgi:hypothetical protein